MPGWFHSPPLRAALTKFSYFWRVRRVVEQHVVVVEVDHAAGGERGLAGLDQLLVARHAAALRAAVESSTLPPTPSVPTAVERAGVVEDVPSTTTSPAGRMRPLLVPVPTISVPPRADDRVGGW